MNFNLNEKQQNTKIEIKNFVKKHVIPYAGEFDRKQEIPRSLIKRIGQQKFLGAILPPKYGGLNWDMIRFGILNEEFGKGCSSVRSLFTVHGMCSYAILRWGTEEQRDRWLSKLAEGKLIGAFALSEPDVGSDAKSIKTKLILDDETYILNGSKKWITFGQIADILLVIAQIEGQPIALIAEKNQEGISIEPITDLLGTRAAMLSNIHFKNCKIPKTNIIGGPGFGFSAVALSALDIGRYSVAAGSVGIAQACLEASVMYANQRKQFEVLISENQLIRKILADMDTNTKAARFLYYYAGFLLDNNSDKATEEVMRAKYFAGKKVNDIARHALQIHGGNGCSKEYPIERYFRDAKIMEIIEGTNQMLQVVLGKKTSDFLRN